MANQQNEILDMLRKMNDRFDTLEKLSNDSNARLEKLSNDTNARLEKISNDTNAGLEKLSDDVNARLEKLSNDINEFRGETTERHLRHEAQKMYGDAYEDRFVIEKGVDGLIRLVRRDKETR